MNFKVLYLIAIALPLTACLAQENNVIEEKAENSKSLNINKDSLTVVEFYRANMGNNQPSRSTGTVGKGTLINGKLPPFYGPNFQYFDVNSYLSSRAFTHHITRDIILEAYQSLEKELPSRYFYLMELSSEEGGKLYPHKTHQNGLSVDFMMPKLKDGKDYYGLDTLGVNHYLLKFNDHGEYDKDPSITIDFDVMARHLLILNDKAEEKGYKIAKVIIKIEYKDKLFATEYGKKLKSSGIYLVQNLSPLVNSIHDEHYHVDFEKIK